MHHATIVDVLVSPTTLRVTIIAMVVHALRFEVLTVIKVTTSRPTHVCMPVSSIEELRGEE